MNTTSKNNSLKSRLQALNVKRPTVIQNEHPRKEDAPRGLALPEQAQRELALTEQGTVEPARAELAQTRQAQSDQAPADSSAAQQVPDFSGTNGRQDGNIAPGEQTQNQQTPIDIARAEQARKRQAHNDLGSSAKSVADDEALGQPKGYFKLSHDVFWNSTLRNLSGDCFRLFLWMSSRAWRFPNSDGTLRASVRFITDQTGIARATVVRSLGTLRETELIAARVDYRDGNVWQVSSKAVGRFDAVVCSSANPQQIQNEPARVEQIVESERASTVLKKSMKDAQIDANYNYILIKSNKYSLSESDPEILKLYFQNLKPARKREAEWKSFCDLLVQFSKQELGACLDYLKKYGIPPSNDPCHSPFAFLSVGMAQVLALVEKQSAAAKRSQAEREQKRQKLISEEEEERRMQKAVAEFDKHFPTEEHKITAVTRFKQESGVDTRFVPESVIRRLAINWFQERGSH